MIQVTIGNVTVKVDGDEGLTIDDVSDHCRNLYNDIGDKTVKDLQRQAAVMKSFDPSPLKDIVMPDDDVMSNMQKVVEPHIQKAWTHQYAINNDTGVLSRIQPHGNEHQYCEKGDDDWFGVTTNELFENFTPISEKEYNGDPHDHGLEVGKMYMYKGDNKLRQDNVVELLKVEIQEDRNLVDRVEYNDYYFYSGSMGLDDFKDNYELLDTQPSLTLDDIRQAETLVCLNDGSFTTNGTTFTKGESYVWQSIFTDDQEIAMFTNTEKATPKRFPIKMILNNFGVGKIAEGSKPVDPDEQFVNDHMGVETDVKPVYPQEPPSDPNELKVGDWVECITSIDATSEGRRYEIIELNERGYFYVKDDQGHGMPVGNVSRGIMSSFYKKV